MTFFRSLGFDIPKRKGIPDFLQEVSGKKDQEVTPPPLPPFPSVFVQYLRGSGLRRQTLHLHTRL